MNQRCVEGERCNCVKVLKIACFLQNEIKTMAADTVKYEPGYF